MTALCVGVDFSSKRLDVALIPLDADHGSDCPPVTLRHHVLPVWRPASTTPQYRSVERCRLVRDAMRKLTAALYMPMGAGVLWLGDHHVAHVCVEEPFGSGRKADNVMRELYGAILASIPPHIQRDTIGTQEWRRIIWPRDDTRLPDHIALPPDGWKTRAIFTAHLDTSLDMDEHEAEAYLLAVACRTRMDADARRTHGTVA